MELYSPTALTSPTTLEHLELNIRYHNSIDDGNPFYENLRDAWSHLDSITTGTHPTDSRLQRVDINIYSFPYWSCDDGELIEIDEDELLKSVIDGLPLLRRKGILFVKFTLME